MKFLKKVRGVDYVKNKAESYNYVHVIREAIYSKDRCFDVQKNHFNILMGMHMQLVNEQKQMQNAGFLSNCLGNGVSDHLGTGLDKYVLSRGWNMPELIFN